MNKTEASIMLTYVARIDHRTLGEEDAKAFADLLDDIAFPDAMAAAREHLRTETTWLTPALLRGRVFTMNSIRADDKPAAEALPEPDADPDDWRAYQEALRDHRVRTANPDARPRPIAALLAGSFGRIDDDGPKAAQQRKSVSRELFTGYAAETKRVRELVMSYPDLREALTRPPIGYPQAEQWNGYIPPEFDGMGQRNTIPRRTALAALAAEAQRRADRQQSTEATGTSPAGSLPTIPQPPKRQAQHRSNQGA
jgi:hypothetical protein